MKDEIKGELDALFADDANRKVKAEQKRDLEAEQQDAFLQQFRAKADEVIVPAFEEFGQYLLQHGWAAQVKRQPEQQGQSFGRGASPTTPESVRLVFSKATSTVRGIGGRDEPAFTIGCDKAGRKVNFHEMTPSMAGGAGYAKLDDLNADFLQKRLVTYFKKLMNDARPYDER